MGASAAAAAAAAAIRATKASGAIVRVEPADFLRLLARSETRLVVSAYGGLLRKRHRYLTSYKGLFFFTQSPDALALPRECEVVTADRIWVPD